MTRWNPRLKPESPAEPPLPPGPTPGHASILNAAPEPPPPDEAERMCEVLSGFCLGKIDGRVVDVCPGERVRIEGRRARELERKGFVKIVRDPKVAALVEEGLRRIRLERATAAAKPVPPTPPPQRPPDPVDGVRVRALKSFCVAAGWDCAPGDEFVVTVERAEKLIRIGFAELVSDEAAHNRTS